jgi:hypothetical protein
VSEYIGCDWLAGLEEQALLSTVYTPPALRLNFFILTQKLKSKIRTGSKETRAYDEPRSPFQRLIGCGELPRHFAPYYSPAVKEESRRLYR